MSFPVGLDLCPNDGERLIITATRAPDAPVSPTESLAQGSSDRSPYVSPDPTASLAEEIDASDLTRAASPKARSRNSRVTGGTPGTRSRDRGRRRAATRKPEERIGAVMGNYKILDMLGRGGMGCVYEAEHIKLGRRVALKLLREDHAQRRDAVARFFQEARSVNRIRHRNIVDVTDFVELPDGTTFLVMELLQGASLGRVLRKEGLTGPRALALLIQMCDGLAAAHEMGIVHRDLKPDNIFVVPTRDGAELIKLLDFGVAKLLWRDEDDDFGFQTAAGAVVGTPTYMSPEQAGGMEIDARSDIYSLGAIMYEMFTGQPLFRGKSFGEFVRKHLSEEPVPPSHTEGGRLIDDRLETIIMTCLEKAPSARFQHIGELKQELMGLLGAVETSMPPSTAALAHHGSVGSAVAGSALEAPQLHTATPATTYASSASRSAHSTHGSEVHEVLQSADLMPYTPSPGTHIGSAAHVPETAMSMGDLPGHRSDVRAPGRAVLWLGLTLLAAGAAALAIFLATRGGDDETAVASTAPTASSGPVVTPMDPGAVAPSAAADDDRFTVRFLSTPSAQVIELSTGDAMCTTPCDVTVDPATPGPTAFRDYELRQRGYYPRTVRIDLAQKPRTVNPRLQRVRSDKSGKTRRPSKRPEPTTETPIADKPDPPVVQPEPKDPPPDKPRPKGPIDPTETLDPFDNP